RSDGGYGQRAVHHQRLHVRPSPPPLKSSRIFPVKRCSPVYFPTDKVSSSPVLRPATGTSIDNRWAIALRLTSLKEVIVTTPNPQSRRTDHASLSVPHETVVACL